MYRPIYWLLFIYFLVDLPMVIGQDFLDYIQINYTIEDGLPSNECHEILQDSLGYIWIATDRGLVRYDGYEFKTYGIPDGLKDISCLNIRIDKNENIWILTLSGRVFMYDRRTDTCIPYEYQNELEQFLNISKVIDFGLSGDMTFSFAIEGLGILDISESGNSKMYNGEFILGKQQIVTRSTHSNILINGSDRLGAPSYLKRNDIRRVLVNEDSVRDFHIQHLGRTIDGIMDGKMHYTSNVEAFHLIDDIDLVNIYGVNYFFEKDTVNIRKHQSEFEDILVVNDSSYISSELNHKGVSFYKNYSALLSCNKSTLINDVSATHSILDQDGNLWISTIGQGLYKLERKEIKVPSCEKRRSGRIASIEQGHNGIFYLRENNELYKSKPQCQDSLIFFDISSRINSLTFDTFTDELIICKNKALRFTEKNHLSDINYFYQTHSINPFPVSPKEAYVLADSEYFISSPNEFLIYSDLNDIQIYYSFGIEDPIRVLGAARIAKGHYLLGTPKGLLQFKDNKILEVGNRPELLSARINEIKRIGENFLFATQGNGLVIWDMNKLLIHMTNDDGLVSDNIENIFVDDESIIYLSTKSGLSKLIAEGRDSFRVRNYTTFHGLPSNEVNDVTQWNDTIFIATGKGIGLLHEDIEIAEKHKVLIDEILINDIPLSRIVDDIKLSHTDNNLSLRYISIDHSMHSKIDYRYRLNDSPWTETRSTFSNFTALPPKNYVYEVQSKNRDDLWSDSSRISFEIHPPWWRAWWFYTLSICGVGLLGFSYYNRRTHILKNKLEVEREVRDLERAALQAQMNPHFIFNCLNSIQGFIMKNEKEEAMEYLARFAKLIRGNLNASTENKITLDQEFQMLDNYLALEQLRYDNSFTYKIDLDPLLDVWETQIPPMLIQPFIENAVIHGMKTQKEGGFIELKFRKNQDDTLLVDIRDNGPGINGQSESKHKSVGMKITNKRLAHIRRKLDDNVSIYSSKSGTQVSFCIPIWKDIF